MNTEHEDRSGASYRADPGDEDSFPTLAWSERDLGDFLAAAWQQESARELRVVGRLLRPEGASFGFLEDLHHPLTGMRLPAPSTNSRVHQGIFVPPVELQRWSERLGQVEYASASIEISPLARRQERGDPLACTVRPGTLTPLTQVPETWGVHKMGVNSAPLVAEMARAVIEAQLQRETTSLQDELDAVRARVASARAEETGLESELDRVRQKITEGSDRAGAIEAAAAARRLELEKKLTELETLLREKGDRMVALKLIEPKDMESLFPPIDKVRDRPGHDFVKDLGADWGRLAGYLQAHLWQKGMHYTRAQLLDFVALLRTNDLIVLAGDSGSGKTSLVKSVAEAIGGQCTVVPVKPNWTSSDDLLGYYNPIEGRYHPSQFLLALLEAARDPNVPHFICLDEMNLARVEYYFADFLSLLETRGSEPWVHLYSAAEERQTAVDNRLFLTLEEEARTRAGLGADASLEDLLLNDEASLELRKLAGFQEADTVLAHHARLRRALTSLLNVPAGFRFPRNAWIIGSINVDETTHYLSPKILDRAHVMRFSNPVLVDWDAIQAELEPFELDLSLPVNVAADDLGTRVQYPSFDRGNPEVAWLAQLSREYLDPLGVEFGLRALRQSSHYINKAMDGGMEAMSALNNIVLHKVLPKLVVDLDKAAHTGEKRRDLMTRMATAFAEKFASLDRSQVADAALERLQQLLDRAESNNGIANFWAR